VPEALEKHDIIEDKVKPMVLVTKLPKRATLPKTRFTKKPK